MIDADLPTPDPPPAPSALGAECAVHHGRPAEVACRRCGAYACELCVVPGGEPLCERCRELTGDGAWPLERGTWTLDSLVSRAWAAWKGQWLLACAAFAVLVILSWLLSFIGEMLPVVGVAADSVVLVFLVAVTWGVFETVVTGIVQLGFYRMCTEMLERRPAELGMLFGYWRKAWRYFLLALVRGLLLALPVLLYAGMIAGVLYLTGLQEDDEVVPWVIAAASLVGLVPWTWYALGFLFALLEMAYDDSVGPIDAIRRSWVLVEGQRLRVLGVTVLAVVVGLLGLLACLVGAIATGSFASVVFAGLYLSVRRGSGLPPPAIGLR